MLILHQKDQRPEYNCVYTICEINNGSGNVIQVRSFKMRLVGLVGRLL